MLLGRDNLLPGFCRVLSSSDLLYPQGFFLPLGMVGMSLSNDSVWLALPALLCLAHKSLAKGAAVRCEQECDARVQQKGHKVWMFVCFAPQKQRFMPPKLKTKQKQLPELVRPQLRASSCSSPALGPQPPLHTHQQLLQRSHILPTPAPWCCWQQGQGRCFGCLGKTVSVHSCHDIDALAAVLLPSALHLLGSAVIIPWQPIGGRCRT